MAQITVIGSFVMDNVAHMDHFPTAGESVIGSTIELFPGGKGANQCVAIARLGGDTEMIGMLGKDANGVAFRRILRDEGICSRYVFDCDTPTAVAQIQIDATGQNRICVIPAANHCFDFDCLKQIDHVLRETALVVLQLELRLDVTTEIICRCHNYGVPVLLNPAPAVMLDSDLLGMVDYLTPNETELSILTGMPTDTDAEVIAAANRLISLGTKCVVATLGSRGALYATSEGAEIIPGYRADAIDTVAAGDSFNGALAVAITEGHSMSDAIRFANAMGALTVTVNGAIPSLHTRAEVEAYMSSQEV